VDAQVSLGFVNKILEECKKYNFSTPQQALSGQHKSARWEDVRAYLRNGKLNKPNLSTSELQARLLLNGLCFTQALKLSLGRFLTEEL